MHVLVVKIAKLAHYARKSGLCKFGAHDVLVTGFARLIGMGVGRLARLVACRFAARARKFLVFGETAAVYHSLQIYIITMLSQQNLK